MANDHILFIDSNPDEIKVILNYLKQDHNISKEEVVVWQPQKGGNDPINAIRDKLKKETILVVTNLDLTGEDGVNSLYGPVIEKLCQSQLIPVGESTRKNSHEIPTGANLFNISINNDDKKAALQIATIYRGFQNINESLNKNFSLDDSELNYSNILARMLGRGHLYYELSKYMESFERVNQFLIQYLKNIGKNNKNIESAKFKLISYVIGHVLLNTILKYPGPIVAARPLCSYLSISETESTWVKNTFHEALYDGPFFELDTFYWLETINDIILAKGNGINSPCYIGAFNQAVVKKLKPNIKVINCKQPDCQLGGYYCPFTDRTVCELEGCSTSSTSWLPSGASLCRVKRNYFDMWQPILNR